MKDKSSLREHFLQLLRDQGSAERAFKSQQIAQKLYGLPAFVKAKTVLFYASLPGEVETFAMMQYAMQLTKKVALPSVQRDQKKLIPTLTDSLENLKNGHYGIQEPHVKGEVLDVATIDAVIVPGLAFDRTNNRLGRGAGYYDRFLATLSERTVTIGIAFDFQIVDCLPKEPHDVALSCVIAA